MILNNYEQYRTEFVIVDLERAMLGCARKYRKRADQNRSVTKVKDTREKSESFKMAVGQTSYEGMTTDGQKLCSNGYKKTRITQSKISILVGSRRTQSTEANWKKEAQDRYEWEKLGIVSVKYQLHRFKKGQYLLLTSTVLLNLYRGSETSKLSQL